MCDLIITIVLIWGRALSQRECVVGGGADFSADLNAVSTTAVNIWE